jgi:hypothetical protein
MKRFSILFTAVLLLGLSSAAYALPTFDESFASAADNSFWTSPFAGNAGMVTQDFNAGSLPSTFSGSVQVVTGTSSAYATPWGDQTSYVVVPWSGAPSGSASFTPGSNSYNYVGLYWGSVDGYNALKIYQNGGVVYTLTGSEVLHPANGYQGAGGSSYVNIYGLDGITSIEFISDGVAFEFDNLVMGNTPVPEPATLLLFGGGLVGLAAWRRRIRG